MPYLLTGELIFDLPVLQWDLEELGYTLRNKKSMQPAWTEYVAGPEHRTGVPIMYYM